MKEELIIVRGGGDIATGTIHRLHQSGFPLLVLETAHPSAIRRQVSLSEAVYDDAVTVDGVTGVLIHSLEEMDAVHAQGNVPILVDETGASIETLRPAVVVDGILAKKNLGTCRAMAPLTIALGPGFVAGEAVDVVIETQRGHNLGRILRQGAAAKNTGIPGMIGGYDKERVIHAPCAGTLQGRAVIGDVVTVGQVIATITTPTGDVAVEATIPGILRGLLRSDYPVTPGFKIADIDPRQGELKNCFTISDKARCIAGSVLEVVVAHWRNP